MTYKSILQNLFSAYTKITIVLFLSILFCTTQVWFSPKVQASQEYGITTNNLFRLVNKERTNKGIPPLKINSKIMNSAKNKGEDMAEKSYFAHTSPDGKSGLSGIDDQGYKYKTAGENIAVLYSSAEDAVSGWMNSQGHRQNILNPKYTETGIAAVLGTYQDVDTYYLVQQFAQPR